MAIIPEIQISSEPGQSATGASGQANPQRTDLHGVAAATSGAHPDAVSSRPGSTIPAWTGRQSNTDEAEELRRNRTGLANDNDALCYALGWLRSMRDGPECNWRVLIGSLLHDIDDGRGALR